MGWVALLLLGGGTFGLLVALRLPRLLWSFAGAALMLGAAGYALQGRPGVPARAAAPRTLIQPQDPSIADLRDQMLNRYGSDAAYLVAADAMTRVGEPKAAVQVLLGGIRSEPRSLSLWTALGNAFAAHDNNQVSPAALFAFQQAARIAPTSPAPPFFLGLARVRAGDFAAARPLWTRSLALAPARASYRRDIAVRLALLDRYLAETGQR